MPKDEAWDEAWVAVWNVDTKDAVNAVAKAGAGVAAKAVVTDITMAGAAIATNIA